MFWVKYIVHRVRGSYIFSYISVIRHLGAVWEWPDIYGCMGATIGAVVGVGTGLTFGVAAGEETRTASFGLELQVQLIVVLVEWLW